jgi:hypothetical protein
MPDKQTLQRARQDRREGKSASTQAGEFVREEIDHIREGKHGARSAKQAIAIGLSKARRAGVDLPPAKTGDSRTRKAERRDYEEGQGRRHTKHRPRASTAVRDVLKHEGRAAGSHRALAVHARSAAAKRTAAARSASAKRAARTRASE